MIAVTSVAYMIGLNSILAFWLAYIFTRPLGASFGDLLAQPTDYGGLGFGTVGTSLLFLGLIASIVVYMTVTKSGEDEMAEAERGSA